MRRWEPTVDVNDLMNIDTLNDSSMHRESCSYKAARICVCGVEAEHDSDLDFLTCLTFISYQESAGLKFILSELPSPVLYCRGSSVIR